MNSHFSQNSHFELPKLREFLDIKVDFYPSVLFIQTKLFKKYQFLFQTNILANQVLGTAIASAGGSLTDNGALGDCVSDSMSIASPGRLGSPIICGTNTGQHSMYQF